MNKISESDYEQAIRNLTPEDIALVESDEPLPHDAGLKMKSAREMWLQLRAA